MRIAVIGPIYPFRGGISHSNTMLCSNLSKNHDVKAISFLRLFPKFLFPGRSQKHDEERRFDIDVEHIIDSLNPFNWLRVFFHVKKNKPDLVIMQWWTIFLAPFSFSLLLLLKVFTKVKVCIFCQNVLQHEKRIFDVLLTRMVFGFADYFIVMSRGDLKDIHKIMPRAKAKVIVEPTYDDFFVSDVVSKEEAKRKLGLKGKIILFFGFVRPYKGLRYLLDAMPPILDEVDVTLLVAGEFWGDKEGYMKQISENGISSHVKVVDEYIPDEKISLYLSAADVLVLPYVTATQSAILQTAFGFNKPVITTNVGSLADLVKDNKTGLLVPPKDSKGIARAVIDFYKNDKEKRFVENIKKEKDRFKWGKDKEDILFFGI